jgi:hypothetical protein
MSAENEQNAREIATSEETILTVANIHDIERANDPRLYFWTLAGQPDAALHAVFQKPGEERRREIIELVFEEEYHSLLCRFSEVLAALRKAWLDIPAEFRSSALFEIAVNGETEYERPSVRCTINYTRPETDEEFSRRIEEKRTAEERRAQGERQRELAELARLQAKYGESP